MESGLSSTKKWNAQQLIIAEVNDSCQFAKLFLNNNQTVNMIQPFDDIFAYYIEPIQIPEVQNKGLLSVQFSTVEVC